MRNSKDFLQVLKNRYSSRAYSQRPINQETLITVLEAARLAPTASNCQPFKLIIIHTKDRKEELRKIYNREWFVQAPIVICAVGLHDKAWTRNDGKKYTYVDVAIAMDHLILTATSLELGTCWIAAFDPDAAREILRLPENVEPIVFTTLGYPADKPKPMSRKALEELICYENWKV